MNSEMHNVFERAETLYRKGAFEDCQPLFEAIIRNHPDGYPDVHNRLGVIHHCKGEVEKAVPYFERAVRDNPRYTEASLNLAVAYNDLGRFEEAEEVFRSAAERLEGGEERVAEDAIANRHVQLGNDYLRIGRLKEALHEYRHALTLRPRWVDAICRVGITLRQMGRLDDALRVFARAKELNAKFPLPYVQTGQIYYAKGFLDLAMREWQKALDIDPSQRDAEAFLATVRRALLQQ